MFEPTYSAARSRLAVFVPHAGADYGSSRNYDRIGHPNVSMLSPYLRHRIITEDEVLKTTLAHHSPKAASKFIAEVFWRTYWKGWLEMRPSVWTHYRSERDAARNQIHTQSGVRDQWEAACTGNTGIDCFDHWASELTQTGYLHNHARMWFASIWIFTLRLPWTLGADFFMRHLLDGDPAANTLSWRWVGGLQTVGKTYLATADNIATYTDGRFAPKGLASHATPLTGLPHPAPQTIPTSDPVDPKARTGLLITDEDMSPDWMLEKITPTACATFTTVNDRSRWKTAPQVVDFTQDALTNVADQFGLGGQVDDIVAWAQSENLTQIVTAYAPVGPTADHLRTIQPNLAAAGITLRQLVRPFDTAAWPCATKGFFKFKDKIPGLLPAPDQLTFPV